MTDFTKEFIAEARESITEPGVERYICIPVQLEMLDEIERLQSRIAELSQAVGLITTLKPTMLMDTEHPLDMAKEVAEYVTARIAELEEAQRWIPVSERLPEFGDVVLVCDSKGYVNKDFRYEADGKWKLTDFVRHWMPLPKPPEVQG